MGLRPRAWRSSSSRVDKDATDTELALARAAAVDAATDLLLLGGAGDRLDHALGTLVALGSAGAGSTRSRCAACSARHRVHVLHPGRVVVLDDEPAGSTFSVLALHGACHGVEVTRARWPLRDADLAAVEHSGVSNETSMFGTWRHVAVPTASSRW